MNDFVRKPYPLDALSAMRARMTGERIARETLRRIERGIVGCTRKREYVTEAIALRAGLRIGRRSGKGWRAYRCECGAWHLTTKRKR